MSGPGPWKCATAPGVEFATRERLLEHYHTDWHRYNLKRKVAGLPMLTEAMFARVVAQTAALAAAQAPSSRRGFVQDDASRCGAERRQLSLPASGAPSSQPLNLPRCRLGDGVEDSASCSSR